MLACVFDLSSKVKDFLVSHCYLGSLGGRRRGLLSF